jgi:hypothetical protein
MSVSVIFMGLAGWAVWGLDKDYVWDLLGESDTEFSNALGVAAQKKQK